jgi:hypothetical protein
MHVTKIIKKIKQREFNTKKKVINSFGSIVVVASISSWFLCKNKLPPWFGCDASTNDSFYHSVEMLLLSHNGPY